ncbi:MAG: heparan-alpha-glucosaminide N-acetyltransferase [Thermoplasmatota archaeon]
MFKDKKRFWEVDFIRGVALLMMITYHLIYDLYYFGDYGIDANSGVWLVLGRSTAILFITIVGVSLSLSYSRVKDEVSNSEIVIKYVKRGGFIFSLGLLITISTYLFLKGEGYVRFGILHLIGLSVILAIPFLRYKYINLIIGAVSLVVGFLLADLNFSFNWLLWLGFRPDSFYTVDYFPVLPWFGLVLLGLFIGKSLYPGYSRIIKIPDMSRNKLIKFISFIGQNTLVFYLIHQPILILLLYLFGLIDIPL